MSEVDVLAFVKARIDECEREGRAYGFWLARLKRTNLITVLLPVTLSMIAGAAILGDLLGTSTTTVAGIAALLGGLLTAVHKGLKCEAHQAECLRLQSAYCGFKTRYEALLVASRDARIDRLAEVDQQLAQLRESVQATVPDWCRARSRNRDIEQRDMHLVA
ncbi:hypothetical protein OG921_06630 [Aldersonia sp. NBC_00410]|uniref:hypothetical protein n=1 Tax=Aldersonia sp. NBC_00410 TaxID=2975954 RepID=UPI002251DDD1|nr:hypothetical protein [Aldersonia sp. NBC_00410]MCX5042842.1 hypothetical protein [Aldersonia sp. NBC_00410]